MNIIKVAGAALNQTPRDWNGNKANILESIKQAKEQNVSVLCLPELAICAYGMEDDYFCLDVSHRSLLKLKEILPYTKNLIVSVGLPIIFNNSLYNSVATIVNGVVVGFTCKQHLANDGIFYESRWFHLWPCKIVQTIEIPELGGNFPIGDIHFNIGGIKCGYEICEDSFVANRPGAKLASQGINIILNPSASNFSFNKLNIRKNLVIDGSRAFGVTYIYSNLVGNESGRIIFDGGTLIATGGSLVAAGKRFTYKNVLLTTAVVDVDNTRTSQVRTASFQPNIEKYNEGCVECDFTYPTINERLTTNLTQESWELSEDIKHEECVRAIGLALMDYMRKSHTKGFTISLSGGADSAMVTYLCAMGIRFGIEELGIVGFIEKYCPHLSSKIFKPNTHSIIEQITNDLISTAYQATENSGKITFNAANEIAKALNTKHFNFDVQLAFGEYQVLGQKIKGSPLNFKDDDVVLQNLQARVRVPGIWMVANIQGKLLLTTSNMSESVVGYCTCDGDMAGGLSPIGGLPKQYIREFLRWVEKIGPEGIGNLESMKLINHQQPTAELRPSNYNQTDEDDLMPYDLLHKIEILTLKNRYSPLEIFRLLTIQETNYNKEQLFKYIGKFFKLFCINQWKREKMAVSFHLDDHNLDPRSWARLPILNSGYEEELRELQEYYLNNSII